VSLDPSLASQVLLAFVGAAVGALLGAATRWSAMRGERRVRLTLELFAEFHAPSFNHVRILAHEALTRAPGMPEAYEAAEGEAKDAVSSVVHYWEKVALLMRIRALDERLLTRFLGQYARWWSELLCVDDSLDDPEWGATLKDISWAFERLKRNPRGKCRR
jgi:hypothetical protein